jgi:hypothetical protein
MVEVATPSGRKYCIDEHEVTRGQYKNFVGLAGKDTGLQGPNCINAGVDNQPKWPTSEGVGETGSWDPPDAPMNYVHYCGASAYCHWAGKKLCGAVGDGKLTYELVTDSNHTFIKDADVVLANLEGDQWYNACTQGGKTTRGTRHPGTCATSIDVLVSESCPGDIEPFTQVYGLYGGVAEITDLCGSAGCIVRASGSQDCVDNGLVMASVVKPSTAAALFRCVDVSNGSVRGGQLGIDKHGVLAQVGSSTNLPKKTHRAATTYLISTTRSHRNRLAPSGTRRSDSPRNERASVLSRRADRPHDVARRENQAEQGRCGA